jgi:hypothetical protein
MNAQFEVRKTDGALFWKIPQIFSPFSSGFSDLSPHSYHVAFGGEGATQTLLFGSDKSLVKLPSFTPSGWLDNNAIIGVDVQSNRLTGKMKLLHLQTGTLEDLGFIGSFVGLVQGGN